jgi:hypothetical protein
VSDAVSYVIGGLLAVWFGLAVLATSRMVGGHLSRFDPADLLQAWDLFARPRVADLILLRRDVLKDGTLTSWRELDVSGPRRWTDFAWNPNLRARRAYLGMARDLVSATRNAPRDQPTGEGTRGAITAMTTRPYLGILRYVTARSHPAAEATQFMVMNVRDLALNGRYDDAGSARIVFVSEIHAVGARVGER